MTGPDHPDPTRESPPVGEGRAIADLVAFQVRLMDATGPTRRGQHAKGHGSVTAGFAVRPDLPEALRVGVFREPATFAALLRFSNGFAADDRQPDVRGLAIKLFDVPGPRLLDDDDPGHDFVLANHPAFFAPTVRRALDFFAAKVALDVAGVPPTQALARLAVDFPLEARLFPEFLGPPPSSPLLDSYWSVTPSRLGATAAKYLVRPQAPGPAAPESTPADSPDFLRLALLDHLATRRQPAAFDFCVQTRDDPATMPLEDPTVEWSSPWVAVATLILPPQDLDGPGREAGGEPLAFNPWRCLPEHQPLGGINRARRAVYEASLARRRKTSSRDVP